LGVGSLCSIVENTCLERGRLGNWLAVIWTGGLFRKALGGGMMGNCCAALYSLHNEQPTKNWYGQGESDCLIKTKHCDGQKVLDCSPTNRERELGLDRRETG